MFVKKKEVPVRLFFEAYKKYQKVYRKVISVAHQRENDRINKRSVNN
jgi:hypothetical protein